MKENKEKHISLQREWGRRKFDVLRCTYYRREKSTLWPWTQSFLIPVISVVQSALREKSRCVYRLCLYYNDINDCSTIRKRTIIRSRCTDVLLMLHCIIIIITIIINIILITFQLLFLLCLFLIITIINISLLLSSCKVNKNILIKKVLCNETKIKYYNNNNDDFVSEKH